MNQQNGRETKKIMENDFCNLKKLISFNTSGEEEGINLAVNFLMENFEKFGWRVNIVPNPDGKNNLVAIFNPKNQKLGDSILLSGHIDTVKTKWDSWQTDPFELIKKGDRLYGCGIADMKFFASAILDLLPRLEEVKRPLIYVATCDEEFDLNGIRTVIAYLKENNIKPKYCILGEPTDNNIRFASKGFYEFETEFQGVSCHSSRPQLGVNAIYAMSEFVKFIESLNDEYVDVGTTLNVGVISGGTMCNVVPERCNVNWEMRSYNKAVVDEILSRIEDKLVYIYNKYKLVNESNNSKLVIPAFCNEGGEIISKMTSILNYPQAKSTGATEAGYYQEYGIDTVIWGGAEGSQCHTLNESMDVSAYVKYRCDLLEVLKGL